VEPLGRMRKGCDGGYGYEPTPNPSGRADGYRTIVRPSPLTL
jgi:hypothetical protein